MQVFSVSGEAGLYVQYSGDLCDSALSLDANLINPPSQYYIRFTAGVATLKVGVQLTGGTSSNTSRVKAVVVTSGTLAGNDGAGILFLEELSGPITAGEDMDTGATTQCVARTTQIDCKVKDLTAKSLLVFVETNTMRFDCSGASPTNSAATPASFGIPMAANTSAEISGQGNVKNFKFINAASASNGVMNVLIRY